MTKQFLVLSVAIIISVIVVSAISMTAVLAMGNNIKGTITARPGDTVVQGGNAGLKHTDDIIHSKVNTKDLTPGHTYTMWWELDINGTRSIVMWADGGVAGPNGQLSFEASIAAGAVVPPKNGTTSLKLDDPFDIGNVTGVAHVIVDHGPPQLTLRGAQTGTRPGGCTAGTDGGANPDDHVELFGDYACAPVQDVHFGP